MVKVIMKPVNKMNVDIFNDRFSRKVLRLEEDQIRFQGVLTKFSQHISHPIVTGWFAIGWHLIRNHLQVEQRSFNDIDIVVEKLSDLPKSLKEDFLINHFHPTRENGHIVIQLVDELHRTRIDVFSAFSPSLKARTREASLSGIRCQVVSVEDILARLLRLCCQVKQSEDIELKHYMNLIALLKIADFDILKELWREYRKDHQPQDWEEVLEIVQQKIETDPTVLQEQKYCKDVKMLCSWCCKSNLFPLASKNKVLDILGYV